MNHEVMMYAIAQKEQLGFDVSLRTLERTVVES